MTPAPVGFCFSMSPDREELNFDLNLDSILRDIFNQCDKALQILDNPKQINSNSKAPEQKYRVLFKDGLGEIYAHYSFSWNGLTLSGGESPLVG